MLRLLPKLATFALLLTSAAAAAEKKRVLFLGDPVQRQIVTAAAKEFGDRAEIHFPKGVVANDSGTALKNLDSLLGNGEWDLIYFNFGLGELFHKDPRTREIRAMSKHAGGVPVATPEQYEANLEQLVRRLQATGAKLLWGSTTPLVTIDFFPSFKGNLFEAGSEVGYNAIAARVMKRHRVPVVDLHSYVMQQFEEDEKHPPYPKYEAAMRTKGHPLHQPLVKALQKNLK